ncbi:MAG: Gfo/Idh/MocA family oxidoreductase [Anaerolineae bacterium]|nr:Gfo/Idh/MocA family oxidoreductase [Anaerolineae bacterium]
MSAKTLRVGIIGAGGIARNYHVPNYLRCENVQVVAACDVSDVALQQMQAQHGIAQVFHDYRELLALESLDLVSVCTSNDMHYPVVMAAIERGLDIYCEKPLALTYAQAAEMHEAAQVKGLKTGVNFSHRRTPAARLAKEIIDRGALGQIHYVSAIYAAGGTQYGERPGTWRNDGKKAGFGGLGDMGSHIIDMMMWWLDAPIEAVAAQMAIHYPDRIDRDTGLPMRVSTEDQGLLLVRYGNGALGYVYGGYVFTGRGFDQRVEIYGSKGGLIYDQQHSYELQVHLEPEHLEGYHVLRQGGTRDRPYTTILVPEAHQGLIPGEPGARRGVLMDFIEAYRAEGPFSFSPGFYEGMRVQEVLEGARLADAERRWVGLPL